MIENAVGNNKEFPLLSVLKDAIISSLIVFEILASTLGIKVISLGNLELEQGSYSEILETVRLSLSFSWFWVIFATIAMFVFRVLVRTYRWRKENKVQDESKKAKHGILDSVPFETWSKIGSCIFIAFVIFAAILPIFPFADRANLDLATLVLIYIMLGWGLNVVVGLAGLLDLGYVAFYAVGAYSYALLAQHFGFSFWICLPLAGILAAFWGVLLGFPVLRLRGDYLAIVTLAFGEIIHKVLINWYPVTGGSEGIPAPKPSFFGLPMNNRDEPNFHSFFGLEYDPGDKIIFLYYLIFFLALITYYVTMKLRNMPIGRAWEALRENEIACRSLGMNTTNTKLTAFAIGAMFAGFAGSFFAAKQGHITPSSFTFIESAIILAIVVLGGLGSTVGVIIASIIMIGVFDKLRAMQDLKDSTLFGYDLAPIFADADKYRMLIFGLAMILIMVWKPRGLVSRREPSVYLKEKKAISGDLVAEGEG